MHRTWLKIDRTLAALAPIALLTAAGPAAAETDPCAEVAPEPASDCKCAVPAVTPPEPAVKAGLVRVRGKVVGKRTSELLAGVTIVAVSKTSPLAGGEAVTISDEHGAYFLDLPLGTYSLVMYYLETTLPIDTLVVTDHTTLGVTVLDETVGNTGCVFWLDHASPDFASIPRFGVRVNHGAIVVSRDRTHRAWIAPAAAANPATLVVTLDGGARLQSAPGVPIAFVEEVAAYTMRIPIELAAGAGGGADIALRSGSNTTKGDARLVLGLDGKHPLGGIEVFTSGPLKRDKAWIGAGLVANRDVDDVIDASGMLHVNYARTSEHQGSVAALAQGRGDELRDGWSNARWTSKFLDNRLELTGVATAEQLELPAPVALADAPLANVVNRAGGKLGLQLRKRLAGYHTFVVTAGGGGGYRGDDAHSDLAVAAGDQWQVKPNIDLHLGVRSDTRTFAGERATVTSPRAAIVYDFTKEGRSDVFVQYQRVSRLDDGLPGDWRLLDARRFDEAAAGASYLPSWEKAPMFGVATRVRFAGAGEPEVGVEGWLRYERRATTLHLGATSFGRVGTVMAQRRIYDRDRNAVYGAATLRASPDRTEGGGALVWRHTGKRHEEGSGSSEDLDVDLSLEGHGGTAGPGARLLLGLSF